MNVCVCVRQGHSTRWERGWWIERPRNPSASPLFMSSRSPPGLVYLLYLSQIILFVAEPLGNTSPPGQRGEEKGSWEDEWRPRERRRRRERDGPRSPRKQALSLGQQTGTPHTWDREPQNSPLPALSSPSMLGFLQFIIIKQICSTSKCHTMIQHLKGRIHRKQDYPCSFEIKHSNMFTEARK